MALVLSGLVVATGAAAGDSLGTPTQRGAFEGSFQAHLDRLKVPLQLPTRGKAIVVNIPAFELIAFEDGAAVVRSRVIVGAPWHRTPRLVTHTSSVRFRPTWRPTPAMVASGEYRDRVWPPGPGNPLGLAAIRLEEGLLVYLHDTNRPELFDEANRALSHGCIRVQRWDELVAWVLDLELASVHRLANGDATQDVATDALPVILGYFLTFPNERGEAVRYEDVYGLGPDAARLTADASDDPGRSEANACEGTSVIP